MRYTPLAIVICATLALASSTVAFANTAAIFDMTDWQSDYHNYDDAVLARCFAAKDTWGIYGANGDNISVRQEQYLTNSPAVLLGAWRDLIPNASDADITSHGGAGGWLAAEYYASSSACENIYEFLYTDPEIGEYDTLQIDWAPMGWGPDAYVIAWTPQGIEDFLSDICAQAILYADYCHSCESASSWKLNLQEPWWGEAGGSMFCYTESQPNQPETDYRENIYGAMSSLGCFYYPDCGSSVGDAEMEVTDAGWDIDITVLGDRENSYHLDRDCHNPAAAFDGVFAFDGKVVFRTVHEAGSICFFVMGLDSWRDVNAKDWKSWDVLARVRPKGGRGVPHGDSPGTDPWIGLASKRIIGPQCLDQ